MTTVENIWANWASVLKLYILKRVSDPATADDILQDVFLKIHLHLHSINDLGKLPAWIYQIAHNTIVDHFRRNKSMASLIQCSVEPEEYAPNDLIDKLSICIKQMILTLPPKYRRALELTVYGGLTQKQMGEQLGLSASGAKSRVQRARKLLKSKLQACCTFKKDCMGNIIDYKQKAKFTKMH